MAVETLVTSSGVTVEGNAPAERPSISRRAELLAGMDKLDIEPKPKKNEARPEPKPPEKKPAPRPNDEDDDDDVDDQDDDEDEAARAPKKKPEDAGDSTELEPDAQKRIAAIQRAEKRSKTELAKQRDELRNETDRLRAQLEREWRPRVEAAQKMEKLLERARRDPDAIIEMLGLKDEDISPLSNALYLRSTAAKADPKHKAAADAALRERDARGELAKLRSELDELRKARETETQRSSTEREIGEYLDRIVRRLGKTEDAPLAKARLEKNPAKARSRLQRAAAELAQALREEHGESAPLPKAGEVIRALEQRLQAKEKKRAERRTKREDSLFKEYGLDAAALRAKKSGGGKPAAPSKVQQGPSEKTDAKDSKSARADIIALMPD